MPFNKDTSGKISCILVASEAFTDTFKVKYLVSEVTNIL